MLQTHSTLFLILALASTSFSNESKIYGGTPVSPNQYGFVVSIQFKGDRYHFCGGAIVKQDYVVTAAQCCSGDALDIEVVAGEHNLDQNDGPEQRKQAESYVLHSLFDDFTLQNDICLIKTTEPFTFNDQVKAMNSPMGEGQNFDDTTAVMVGWGSPAPNQDYSSVLLSATVDVVDDTTCRQNYEANTITEKMICAAAPGVGACLRDSGSPLICKTPNGNDVVCGLSSFGYGCAVDGFPSVYTEISYYLEWIDEVIDSS